MQGTLTADGTIGPIVWPGGAGTFNTQGTFGGGTLTLYWCDVQTPTSPNAYTAVGTATTVTSATTNPIGLTLGMGFLKAVLAGSTSPNLYCAVTGSIGNSARQSIASI